MAYNPEDLDLVERTLLGVLSVGLPPSKAAGSDTFRVDHVTAVLVGLQESGEKAEHLGPDGVKVTPEFRERLTHAIEGLAAKELVAQQATGMPAAAGGYEAGLLLDLVEPDQQPAVLDRYLSQVCMEALFNEPLAYPFLMERYSASGEVWRRLREGGYARD